MADHSVIARDELHESEASEASEASVFCSDNASPEKSCFVDGLVCFISLCLRVFEFLNATRRKSNLPQERESLFQFPRSPLQEMGPTVYSPYPRLLLFLGGVPWEITEILIDVLAFLSNGNGPDTSVLA